MIKQVAHLEHFSIGHHEWAGARNVKVALEELAVAAPRHLRLIAPVHLPDVVALDAGDAVQRYIACERGP